MINPKDSTSISYKWMRKGFGSVGEYFRFAGNTRHFVLVAIKAARELPPDQDYYCLVAVTDVSFGCKAEKTKILLTTSGNVQWSEEISFEIDAAPANLTVELFSNTLNQTFGSVAISLLDHSLFLDFPASMQEIESKPATASILQKFNGAIKVEQHDEPDWHQLIREDGTKDRGELLVGIRKRIRIPPMYDVRRIARAVAISLVVTAAVALLATVLAYSILRPKDPAGRGAWRTEPPMLVPRAELAASAFQGRLFALGGCCALSSVESLGQADAWRAEPPMLDPRGRAGALVAADGALWAVGGMDSSAAEAFDGVAWARRAALSARRAGAAAFRLNSSSGGGSSRLCVLGREGGLGNSAPSLGASGQFATTAECLSPSPNRSTGASAASTSISVTDPYVWSSVASAQLPSDRVMFAATGYGGGVAVVGGWLGGPVGTLEVYNSATAAWSRGPDMPTPRYALAVAEFADRLFAAGGSAGSGPLAVVESFDGAAWRTEPALARPRQLLALAVFAGRLFALGGRGPGPGALALADVESYAPLAPE